MITRFAKLGSLLLLLVPGLAHAAISYDNSAQSMTPSATTITVGSCANEVLIALPFSTSDTVTAVSDGGTPMTSFAKAHYRGAAYGATHGFYEYGAAAGSHTISVTGSYLTLVVISYCGVAQTGFPDASGTQYNDTNVSSFTQSITTIASSAWTVIAAGDSTGSSAAGTGTTLRQRNAGSGSNAALFLGDSNGPVNAGPNSLGVSYSPTASYSSLMFSLAPAATAPSTPSNFGSLIFFGWW